MTFEKFWDSEERRHYFDWDEEAEWAKDLVKATWNAAIEAADTAVESADHNDDDSGNGANCNAMMAVEKLKAL